MSRPALSRKYLPLQQDYPKLYKLAIRDKDLTENEMAILENMINCRERVRDGQMTLEDAGNEVATSVAQEFQPNLLNGN